MCECTHVSGTPAGLWKHTWVFHGEVAVLHHMLGSHTPWHIPLRCKPASNLGTFMAFGAIDRTLVRLICPHTCKNTHTHIHKHAQTCCRVFLSELPATSSACCLERTGNTTGSTRDLLIHTHRHTADLIRTCTHRSFEAAGK